MKRSPIRRRARKDPVTPETHAAVLVRDRACVLSKRDPEHVCRDQWGNRHDPDDLARLSLEHVKSELRAGRRAPSDPAHLVAMCHGANLAVPSKAEREWMRGYLASVNTVESVA